MNLVYSDILKRVKNPNAFENFYEKENALPLIENFKEENLQSVSYDVTMGKRILVENTSVETIDLNSKNSVESVFHEEFVDGGYVLKPNEFILVQLAEKINMPDDLCAHIRPRTTFNRMGIVITNQHLNPSYSGILQIGIKNMTNHAYRIKPGIKIGQIVFETLSGNVDSDKLYRNIKKAKYQNEGSELVRSKVYDDATIAEGEQLYKDVLKRLECE